MDVRHLCIEFVEAISESLRDSHLETNLREFHDENVIISVIWMLLLLSPNASRPLLLNLCLLLVDKLNAIPLHDLLRNMYICMPGIVLTSAPNKEPVVPLALQLLEPGSQLVSSPREPVLVGHQWPVAPGLIDIAIGSLATPCYQVVSLLLAVVIWIFDSLLGSFLEVSKVTIEFSECRFVKWRTVVADSSV